MYRVKMDPGTPIVTLWYKEICNVLPHEKIGSVHKDNDQSFLNIWKPLMNHLPVEC